MLDELFSATYEELRRLASSVRGKDRSETLNPTALVNETYLRLARSLRLEPASRIHFKRLAARAMRQILVEAARRRSAHKRGGDVAFIAFDDALEGAEVRPEHLLALDEALTDLARLHPRRAMMVECRFFGGFDLSETAELMGISEATIARDWRGARAWLCLEMRRRA